MRSFDSAISDHSEKIFGHGQISAAKNLRASLSRPKADPSHWLRMTGLKQWRLWFH
jgi:hypothetical protein